MFLPPTREDKQSAVAETEHEESRPEQLFPSVDLLPSGTAFRLMVVDGHYFTRLGVCTYLAAQSGNQIVAEAASGSEAVSQYQKHRPDIVIMEMNLTDMDGVALVRMLKTIHGDTKVLMLTERVTEGDVNRAVAASVLGYLPKWLQAHHLLQAVRVVAGGGRYFPEAVRRLLREYATHSKLSSREVMVLGLIAKGLPNKTIAQSLSVSEATVKTYVARIMTKLGVHDRTQAVLSAIKKGLLDPEVQG